MGSNIQHSIQQYRNIYYALTNVICTQDELKSLKEHFKREINSARRLDNIKTISQLLQILQKRDHLNVDNINAFEQIATFLRRPELLNSYRNPVPLQPSLQPNRAGLRVIPPVDANPERRINELICTNIGRKWKEFARQIGVSEGQIDQMERQHHYDISECTLEVLRFHRENCDAIYWQTELQQALERARKRDLSNHVGRILAASVN